MREIKFRQPNFLNGKFHSWHYWGYVDEDSCGSYFVGPGAGLVDVVGKTSHGESQQYTGLKDKNGVEICEGDIVENSDWVPAAHAHNYRNEVVRWDNDDACFMGWNYNIDGMTCEIIGNIYENPELMESK